MSLLKDILTGALPPIEWPGYVAHVASKHIGFTCAVFALAATGIALIVLR